MPEIECKGCGTPINTRAIVCPKCQKRVINLGATRAETSERRAHQAPSPNDETSARISRLDSKTYDIGKVLQVAAYTIIGLSIISSIGAVVVNPSILGEFSNAVIPFYLIWVIAALIWAAVLLLGVFESLMGPRRSYTGPFALVAVIGFLALAVSCGVNLGSAF